MADRRTGTVAVMTSPAMPNLTPLDYKAILEVLRVNPTAANEHARHEIEAYLNKRATWIADARARQMESPL